jgi:hypothetical protein
MVTLDVVVPPGVGPGDAVAFQDSEGVTLEALVPDGLSEGDTFQVQVGSDGQVHPMAKLNEYVEARAASGDLMDAFVAWFEREAVGEQVDSFITANASRIGAVPNVGDGEQSLEWWPIYQEYQQQFDVLLQQFLTETGCTAHEFMAAASGAEGMNEMYLQLFLAHSDYQVFVELMSEEAQKQRAKEALAAGD